MKQDPLYAEVLAAQEAVNEALGEDVPEGELHAEAEARVSRLRNTADFTKREQGGWQEAYRRRTVAQRTRS